MVNNRIRRKRQASLVSTSLDEEMITIKSLDKLYDGNFNKLNNAMNTVHVNTEHDYFYSVPSNFVICSFTLFTHF